MIGTVMKGQVRLFIALCIFCVLCCSHASAVDEGFDYSRTVRIIQVVEGGGYVYGLPRLFSIHEVGPKNRFIQLYEMLTKYADRFESPLIDLGPAEHELLLINLSVRRKILVGDSWLSDGVGYAILEDRDNQILQRILRSKIENSKKTPFKNISQFVDRYMKRYDMTEEQVDEMFSDKIEEGNNSDDVQEAPTMLEESDFEVGPTIEFSENEEMDGEGSLNESEANLERIQPDMKANTLPINIPESRRDSPALESEQSVSRSEIKVATHLEWKPRWLLAIAILVVMALYAGSKLKKG
jgi:hypothetical protein